MRRRARSARPCSPRSTCCSASCATAALVSGGISLEEARDAARREGAANGTGGAEVDIREILNETAQCARQRGAAQVEVEHLLRSALVSEDHGAQRVLERLGVAPDTVLAELDSVPPADGGCAGA